MADWLIEFIKGLGRLFLNPLFYWFFIVTFLASQSRINKERETFGRKVLPLFDELYGNRLFSLVFGLVLSIIALLLGVVLHELMYIGLILFSILFSINKKFNWLSSAYTFGFTAIALLFLPYYQTYLPLDIQTDVTTYQWVAFTTLMGLLLIYEALSIHRVKEDQTFPEMVKSTRGKWIGQHRLKKIGMIPLIALIPSGLITPIADWWPMISFGEDSYGLLIFPMIVGFEQVICRSLPVKATKSFSQPLFILGFLVIGFALAGYFLGVLTLISVAIAVVGREWITYQLNNKDDLNRSIFIPQTKGLRVLAILPGTPAEELDLRVGETIVKVNGEVITNQTEFYEALQTNRAFCKLDIIDERGELRFAQRALYQGEHHELGIIFAIDPTFHEEGLA